MENGDYVKIMDEDRATLPLEEVVVPPKDEVRTQVPSLGQDGGVSLPNIRVASEFKSFKGLSMRISFLSHSSKRQRGEWSSLGRFMSSEDNVTNEGC